MAHEELPSINITPGAIRFNTDSMKLEYFRIGMEGGSTSSYAGIGTMQQENGFNSQLIHQIFRLVELVVYLWVDIILPANIWMKLFNCYDW